MRVPVLSLAIVVLLSAVDGSQASLWFGGGNDRKKRQRTSARRRLTDVDEPRNVDFDAATGTVTLTEEQHRLAEKASSCDGQLAQALVNANDAEFKAQQERDEALQAKQVAMDQIAQLQKTIQNLESQMEETKARVTMAEQEKESAVQQVVQQKDGELEALKVQLAEADSKERATVAATEQAKDEEISSLKTQLEATKGDVETQLRDQVEQVNAEAEAKVAEITAQMKQQKKESDELLAATKEESKRVLREKVQDVKDKLNDVQTQAKTDLEAKDQEIKQIKAQNERFSKYQEEMLAMNREYEKELEHWRDTFDNRSYCNMTQIGEDFYEITATAYSTAAQAASAAATRTAEVAKIAATELNVRGQRLTKELSFHVEYGYNKSMETYNEQYKKHWPKIKPHYDEHVSPLVEKFLQWKSKQVDPKLAALQTEYRKIKTNDIDPFLKTLNSERKKRFAHLVTMFESHCKTTYKHTKKMAENHDWLEKFGNIDAAFQDTCRNPEHSVTIALRTIAVLLLLPFTGRILGLAWSMVRLVWNIFLTVTLLRFILPRGDVKKRKASIKKQPVPDKVPSNGGVTVKKKRSTKKQ